MTMSQTDSMDGTHGADLPALRAAVVAAYRRLAGEGLLRLSAGNVSARVGSLCLVTPTGCDETVRPDDLVLVDREGRAHGPGIPSSEWAMHTAIYERCPDAGAIVHTHADHCTALACLRRPIPAFHYMVATFGGHDVPCVPYSAFGSRRLAADAAGALEGRSACLLANHGMICRGATVAGTVVTALSLESVARHYCLALAAGEPVLLDGDAMAEATRRFGFYGRARIPDAP